jgi:GTP-binding protein
MFVDEIKVYARAGHGGKGCVAFQREKYRPKGGPSGGNGGRGGEVILEANHDLNNLIAQYYQPRLLAEDGQSGLGKGMDGHAGKDLVVKVPCGTLVWKLDAADGSPAQAQAELAPSRISLRTSSSHRQLLRAAAGGRALEMDLSQQAEDEAERSSIALGKLHACSQGELIADLTQHGQRFVLCQGGRGGLGNRNFATAARQTPRFAQPGEPGAEGEFLLELRMMADVGLVGYPNAGKSTLLTAISHARPKVAPYPFTTLHPQMGIVEYPDYYRLTVCDVPGLVAGAHRNVGLGHKFLRHIERCRVLVVLLDMAGTDGRKPWEDYDNLLEELGLYDPTLLDRPRLVVANKMDEAAAAQNLSKFKRRILKTSVLQMAAAFDQGIEPFKKAIRRAVEQNQTKKAES